MPSKESRGGLRKRVEGCTAEDGADRSEEARDRFAVDRSGNSERDNAEVDKVSDSRSNGSGLLIFGLSKTLKCF